MNQAMKTVQRLMLVSVMAAVLLMPYALVTAQEGQGQLCVRAFEDRNRSGARDGGEPYLVDGVSVNLLNEDNVIIETALLSQSARKSEGLVCFQRLMPGVYTLQVVSADYMPTSPSQVTYSIEDSSIPQVLEYGAELIVVDMPTTQAETPRSLQDALTPDRLQRILIAALGAAVVIAFMSVVGVLAWYVLVRPRRRPMPVTATGQYAAVPPTGNYPVATPPPSSGTFRPVTPPTSAMPVVIDQDDTPPPDPPMDDDIERFQPPS